MSSNAIFRFLLRRAGRAEAACAHLWRRQPAIGRSICLPGLTRNARDFHELALYLSTQSATPRQVIAFDYRGRGGPPTIPMSPTTMSASRPATCWPAWPRWASRGAFIGTSRGGLIIHVLGALRPAVLKAVVLNDIGPVIEPAGLAHIQLLSRTRAEAEDLRRSGRRPAQRARPGLSGARRCRLGAHGAGALSRDGSRPAAGFRPEAWSKTVASLDLTQPLPALWPQFEALAAIPMLAIRGANSKLLSVGTLDEMRMRHPDDRDDHGRRPGPCAVARNRRPAGDDRRIPRPKRNRKPDKANPKIKSIPGSPLQYK